MSKIEENEIKYQKLIYPTTNTAMYTLFWGFWAASDTKVAFGGLWIDCKEVFMQEDALYCF